MSNTLTLDEFLEKLDLIKEKNPRFVFRLKQRLQRGDLVEKSGGLAYEIDDPEKVLKMLGKYQDFPYGPIHRKLESDKQKIWNLFHRYGREVDGHTVLPFSMVIQEGLGECVEKAILSQLSLQSLPFIEDQVLVSGNVGYEGKNEIGYHAYNLAKMNGQWVVIDTRNPHAVKEDGETVPYIVPVKGVKLESMLPLELDHQRNGKRIYFMRL